MPHYQKNSVPVSQLILGEKNPNTKQLNRNNPLQNPNPQPKPKPNPPYQKKTFWVTNYYLCT